MTVVNTILTFLSNYLHNVTLFKRVFMIYNLIINNKLFVSYSRFPIRNKKNISAKYFT